MGQAAEADSVDTPFVLEAHYYAGGLRVEPLGTAAVRPAWVPPADPVGFRNEISLGRDESVVEFARFLVQNRRTTWLGVFRKSVDRVFGDRQNHAGVGVWLLENDVVDAGRLLRGLLQLATAVADGEVEAIAADADNFASANFLPKYIRPTPNLPDQFAGWPYARTAVPETALLLAAGKNAKEAWEVAAEQVLRMTVLPSPRPSWSRGLILVRGSAAAADKVGEGNLEPVKKGLVAELLGVLPTAIADIGDQNRELSGAARSLEEKVSQTESALSNTQQDNKKLKDQVAQLKKQAEENDTVRRLNSIDLALKGLTDRTARLDTSLSTLSASSANLAKSMAQRDQRPVAAGGSGQGNALNFNPSSEGRQYSANGFGQYRPYAILLAVALVILGIIWIVSKLTGDEAPMGGEAPAYNQAAGGTGSATEDLTANLPTRDPDNVAGAYAENATVMIAGRQVVAGRLRIVEIFRDDAQNRTFEFRPEEVKAEGALGYTRGRFKVTFTNPTNGVSRSEEGSYVTVHRRDPGGHWQIVEEITSPGRAAAPEASVAPLVEPGAADADQPATGGA